METKINSIKEAFESILCLCAEGVEFLNKVDLAKVIVSEANRGIKVCDELEKTRKIIMANYYYDIEKEIPNVNSCTSETDSPKLPVP